jgi:hypothetical protein
MNIKENRTTKIYLCLDVKTRQGFTSSETLTKYRKFGTWNLKLLLNAIHRLYRIEPRSRKCRNETCQHANDPGDGQSQNNICHR